MPNKPKNLSEAIEYFSDLDVATEYVADLRWPDGWVCPHCGGRDYSYVSTRRLWKCKFCKKQSSVKVGTIFEGSPLGLDKWLPAIWAVANPEEGVSSQELAQLIGTTPKSAVFMLQRIREAAPPPPPAAATRVETPGEVIPDSHPMGIGDRPQLFVALALLVFAFGVVVGRLTRRIR